MITAGIDVGTRFVKACVADGELLAGSAVLDVSQDLESQCKHVYKKALANAGVKKRHVKKALATGYGASLAKKASSTLNGSVCAAKGARNLSPFARTVVDCGGLFITITAMDEKGRVKDQITNDRCAAGSGKFLEMVSHAVEVPFADISIRVAKVKSSYSIASNCAVFAESEVISQVNKGMDSGEVLYGVLRSIAGRAASLFEKINAQDQVVMIGGLAGISAFAGIFEEMVGKKMYLPKADPRLMTAFGAALMAQGPYKR